MSAIEKSGVMKYKDADGQVYLMLPVTTADRVDGAVSYYEQELTSSEKAQARTNIGVDLSKYVAPSGRVFDFRGEWVAGTYYVSDDTKTDVVLYNGCYYYFYLPTEEGGINMSNSDTFDETKWVLLIDNSSSGSGEGSGSSSGSDVVPIIDVYELPETDIQENSAYRLYEPKMIYNGWDTHNTVRSVDGLPETGTNAVVGDGTYIIYFNLQNDTPYVYLDSTTASSLGVSAGWYDLATAAPLAGLSYAGVVTSRADATEADTNYILNDGDWTLYMYTNDRWGRIHFAVKPGSGVQSAVTGHYTNKATAGGSFAQGGGTTASGLRSHAEGYKTTASGSQSHAEGRETTASGSNSYAKGYLSTASGSGSHAEGFNTTASGDYSHTEGYQTEASAAHAHAEGGNSKATSEWAHAEGFNTTASGMASHAEGVFTVANATGLHAQGKYNVEDTPDAGGDGTYAHIVGNGESDDARSNAHTLDWEGNAWYSGDVYTGSTSGTNKDEGSKKLATEEYVDNAVANAGGSSSGSTSTTSIQPDWEQNDETAADYIKNRPFYKDMATIFDEDVTTTLYDGLNMYTYEVVNEAVGAIAVGDSVEVVVDNVTYTLEAKTYELFDGTSCIGNPSIYAIPYATLFAGIYGQSVDEYLATNSDMAEVYNTNTGEPFFILCGIESNLFLTEEAGTYHFTIDALSYFKLDSNYIDSSALLPTVTEDNDGQILGVVDGKWANTDAPSSLPEVTTDDNNKVLMVVDGVWVAGSITDGDEVAY